MKYYYKRTEFTPYCLYTVGYGEGKDWQPESDHDTAEAAAQRVNFLNGGNAPQLQDRIKELEDALKNIIQYLEWREDFCIEDEEEGNTNMYTEAKAVLNHNKQS